MNRNADREKSGDGLAKWCAEAEQVSAYAGFVRGLRQDYAAVEQARSAVAVCFSVEQWVN
jgi:transposase